MPFFVFQVKLFSQRDLHDRAHLQLEPRFIRVVIIIMSWKVFFKLGFYAYVNT